ncbi:sn-glycerol-3-phosphate-binding periplasmic protein UgpB precursor [Thalassovita autumnalis]|uniref:sn-glycerol-3-phosphate-binding Periplasmic protein UgpB n=1 Tax=Thalassovita autumnalis TaxID=2072972 RepID=A0A0P1FMP0_9RHOB|nr:ABC transporter substrate-binding protein [Thalassovita autumnalis]CUH62422.1 sn-glycerol-3-phosphate-binding periplasmic protein UgpB precursor [Thalassovita autumnalis]CUH70274.1 sn-glycerol-3-phosphate-binding periplasmic protein UgpB precursor [Thalassovita autumnalis]
MFANFLKTASVAALATVASAGASLAVDLEFYFPVAVGGAAADTIEQLTAEYGAANPDVNITAIYAGSYSDAGQKALTAARGGTPPQLSVLLSTQMFALIDEDVIVPFDAYLTDEEKAEWIGGFYPSFMENSQTGGKTYGIPFQRSTPVLYWNKEAFKAAGLDPEVAPANWDEMVEMGKALTLKDDAGNVTQWGVRIPSAGFPYWLFQGLSTPAGAILASADGNKVNFNDAKVVEALEYLVDLSKTHEIMQPGSIEWGPTPKAFFEGETAMMWTTTGNLTNVRSNAPFDFGVAMLPAKERRGAPTGGGNFYLFKDSTDEQKDAAVDFVQWITAPEQAATWSIATGYIAPRAETWDTDKMKAYTADFPQALVARDQLEFAVAELSTFENGKVTQAFNDALAAAIAGEKTAQDALDEAQAKAERILKPYQ